MGLLARSFGGDGAKMTAEVACVEGRCEEEDDGIDTGDVGFWERRARGVRTALSGTGDGKRQRRRRGPPKSDLTNGRSALGLGWSWVKTVRYGMGSGTASRTHEGCGAGLITQACDTCAAHSLS